ncbi:hypothetical protein GALMADRAFT_208032 [Galerina marginata CBS 339.88]|uniref:Uncharacterized protein n=1 Tax=Galerina marginata (strain CBS 339.88) TaxID=685588 RepID=A0A067TDC6_GALM3|nr:hypothetical protein GALMADRAFT_208032 [Galerina marginata CBS 339.88]
MSAISGYSPYSPMETGSTATLFSRLNEEPKQNPETRGTNVDGNSCIPVRILGFSLKEITDIVLQVSGAIIASVFGVWAIKSYDSANVANGLAVEALQQSLLANKMTLASLCLGDQVIATSVIATFSNRKASSTPSPIISTIFPTPTSTQSLTFDTTKSSATTHQTDTISTSNFISLGSSNPLPESSTVSPITTNTLSSISASGAGTDLPSSSSPSYGPDTRQSDNSSSLRRNITLSFGGLIGVIISAIVLIAIMGMVLVGRKRARMLKIARGCIVNSSIP